MLRVSAGEVFDVAYIWQEAARSVNEQMKMVVDIVKAVKMIKLSMWRQCWPKLMKKKERLTGCNFRERAHRPALRNDTLVPIRAHTEYEGKE